MGARLAFFGCAFGARSVSRRVSRFFCGRVSCGAFVFGCASGCGVVVGGGGFVLVFGPRGGVAGACALSRLACGAFGRACFVSSGFASGVGFRCAGGVAGAWVLSVAGGFGLSFFFRSFPPTHPEKVSEKVSEKT